MRSATVCPFFHAGEKQEVPLYDIGVFYLSLPTKTLLLVMQRRVLNEDERVYILYAQSVLFVWAKQKDYKL